MPFVAAWMAGCLLQPFSPCSCSAASGSAVC